MASQPPTSIPELCQRLWLLEKRHNLMGLELQGVYIWQAARMHIYYQLAEQLGLYEQPHSRQSGWRSMLRKLGLLARALTTNNLYLNPCPTEVAVFDHPRPRKYDGKVVDIYSYFLCQELAREKVDFSIFERPFRSQNSKTHGMPSRRLDIIESIAGFGSKLVPSKITAQQRIRLAGIEADLCCIMGRDFNLTKAITAQLRQFKFRRYLYGKLLDAYEVGRVYLVISYYMAPLIDSCRQRKIPVFELQHGVISKYHLGYSFPDTAPSELKYFPDYLLAWGSNWPMTHHLPLPEDHVIEYGFKYFEATNMQYLGLSKNKAMLTVISQGVHGNSLAEFLRLNISLISRYQINYKLHPSEIDRYENYPDLSYLESEMPGFKIIEQGDLYDLLAKSEVVVGVFSTALFEALQFDCAVYVCPLSGWEYMEELVADGAVDMFNCIPTET